MGVTNIAIYGNGHLTDSVPTLDQTFEFLRDHGGMAWISLDGPLTNDIKAIEDEFAIHELPIDDAISAHQRPKVEQYNDVLFVVLRPARYTVVDASVVVGELHVFVGVNFVVTVRHEDAPLLGGVAARLERSPELLRFGPPGLLYAILDQVVDDYAPVIAGLEDDIDEVEDAVFGESNRDVSRRIYELLRQVMGFQRATQPLDDILRMLRAVFLRAGADEDLLAHLRDVEDHSTRVIERADGFREILQSILTVHATLVAQRQNEESQRLTTASFAQNEQVKQISAWAGILFVPSIIASIYGMNFHRMPEIGWVIGYPFALALMLGASTLVYRAFKRREWL